MGSGPHHRSRMRGPKGALALALIVALTASCRGALHSPSASGRRRLWLEDRGPSWRNFRPRPERPLVRTLGACLPAFPTLSRARG